MKTLKRRMVLTVCVTLIVVFAILLGMVDLSLTLYYRQQDSAMVSLIKDNGGVIPNEEEYEDGANDLKDKYGRSLHFDEESPYLTRYFVILFDENGKICSGEYEHIAESNRDNAVRLTKSVLQKVLKKNQKSGYIDGYYYTVTKDLDGSSASSAAGAVSAEDDSSVYGAIVFLDCTREMTFQKTVIIMTAVILAFLCILVTLLFALISGRIIRPFEENSRKQKQFITDASHELKTPLAIISANTDVLRFKHGTNSWLDNITDQTVQMNRLIGDLLALTKADEIGDDFIKEPVDLTELARSVWSSFAESAETKKITMKEDLPETVIVPGDRQMLERLFSVLMENAVKYGSENGRIELTIRPSRKHAEILLFNTADLASDFTCDHLFDRFYRPDSSRNSAAGGHGIGLSIAQKITENHKGRIKAETVNDGICFEVTLPRQGK